MNKSDYKHIFVFAEQRGGKLQSIALELLGKARELADGTGEEVVAILAGSGVSGLCGTLIEHGADRIICADCHELDNYLTEQYAQAVGQIIESRKPSIVLFGATTIGRDLAPRLSARLGTGLTADCTKLEIDSQGDLMMTRPAFGGNLMATIKCSDHRPQMSTVRPGVMRPMGADERRGGIVEEFRVNFDPSAFKVRLMDSVCEKSGKMDITQARILVSGGRGVGSREGFRKLEELAEMLGAEVSASRSMVDSGIVEHSKQVGQTGKTVRPDLYFALGISGAVQHLAGMEESGYIVAINRDREAPIFGVADLGIVGDVNKIVPLLAERIRAELAER